MNLLPQLLLATEEVTDPDEGKHRPSTDAVTICHSHSDSLYPEAFLLFSQDIPTANLGFIDSRATTLEVAIRGNEYTIHQSPTLLSSSRAGGTTGAGRLTINSPRSTYTLSKSTACTDTRLFPIPRSPSPQFVLIF